MKKKSLIGWGGAVVVALSTLVAPSAASAQSEPTAVQSPTSAAVQPASTGEYEYICLGTDGSSYSMASGAPLSDCKGSYLQKYINGQQVDSISLSGNGEVASVPADKVQCVIWLGKTAGGMVLGIVVMGAGPFTLAGFLSKVALGAPNCTA